MTVYRRSTSQPFKWLLAIIIFVLAMTITFNEAEGVNIPPASPQSSADKIDLKPAPSLTEPNAEATSAGVDPIIEPEIPIQNDPLLPIPEPSTILIMAAGIGTMYAFRFHKKAK